MIAIGAGARFGRLLILEETRKLSGVRRLLAYRCRCECDEEIVVFRSTLLRRNQSKCWNCHLVDLAASNIARTRPLLERLLAMVTYDFGCLTWMGAITGKGYGVIGRTPDDPGTRLVHRIMFEDVNGPVPDDLQIDHLCRNTLCCNPVHLEAVTNRENTLRGIRHERCSA